MIRASGCAPWSMLLARREMDDILGRLLRFFGLARESLEVEMTNDRGIAALNREFLGLAGPTNVLSFPPGDSQDSGFLGSITVSLETVLRESVLYGQDARLHAARMLAHGILHLLGHEHGPSMQERTESAVWEAAGPLPEDGDQLP